MMMEKKAAVCDVALCIPVVHQCLRGTYCFKYQGGNGSDM